MEDAIVQAFEVMLGVCGISPGDSFFDIGGTSLLAVELALWLETLLARPIPIVLIFQEGSPRSIASALAYHPARASDHAIMLQPGERKAAIFCSPDFWGLPLSYLSLARCLAPAYTVYGLTPGLLRGEMIRRPSIDLLTRAYRDEIRRLRPFGPYIVSGYSAGAVPAFDLACRLEAEGERVLLVLLDPVISRGLPPLPFLGRWWKEQMLPRAATVGWWRAFAELKRLQYKMLQVQHFVTSLNLPRGVPTGDRKLARSMLQAELGWRERRFHGQTVLVQIGRRQAAEIFLDHDGMNGWRRFLLGDVESFSIDSDHTGLMRPPHVGALAHSLAPHLAEFA